MNNDSGVKNHMVNMIEKIIRKNPKGVNLVISQVDNQETNNVHHNDAYVNFECTIIGD